MLEKIEAFVELNRAKLVRYAQRFVRTPEDAEDIVQDTLLRAVVYLPRVPEKVPGKIDGLMYLMVKHRAFTSLQRHKRTVGRETPVDMLAEAAFLFPTACDEYPSDCEPLLDALDVLNPSQRRAFELVTSGASYEDTAHEMQTPVGTVKARVFRAKHRMQAHLLEHAA